MPDGRKTEARHARAIGIDALAPVEVLRHLAQAQAEAAAIVEDAVLQIAAAAELAANALKSGGRLIYAGAGSSGATPPFTSASMSSWERLSPPLMRRSFRGPRSRW